MCEEEQSVAAGAPTLAIDAAKASAGDLDLTFGAGGTIVARFGVDHDWASCIAIQPDRKIIAAGGAGIDVLLARYTASGQPDRHFGTDGVVTTHVADGANGYAMANAVAIQPDKKIVVAGSFMLARFTASGQPDRHFGTDGVVLTYVDGRLNGPTALALQPDGKILVAGQAGDSGHSDFTLARYTTSGELDHHFGTRGTVTTDIAGSSDVAASIVLQPDGKIVLAGEASVAGSPDFALARYTTSGKLDRHFGTGGIVTTAASDLWDALYDIGLQPDGKIIAVGRSSTDIALARYTATGTLDPSFGTGGIVTTHITNSSRANGVVLQPDRKIVIAGTTNSFDMAVQREFVLARYMTTGALDPSFGSKGITTTHIADGDNEAQGIARQTDGRLVVIGSALVGEHSAFALARYTA